MFLKPACAPQYCPRVLEQMLAPGGLWAKSDQCPRTSARGSPLPPKSVSSFKPTLVQSRAPIYITNECCSVGTTRWRRGAGADGTPCSGSTGVAAWIAPDSGSPRAWASEPSCGGGMRSQPTLPARRAPGCALRRAGGAARTRRAGPLLLKAPQCTLASAASACLLDAPHVGRADSVLPQPPPPAVVLPPHAPTRRFA